MIIVAVGCLVISIPSAVHRPPSWLHLLVTVAVVVIARLPLISVRIGSDGLAFNWVGAAVIAALTLLPPAWVPIVVALGTPAVLVRQRRMPVKALFNLANEVVAAALAVGAVLLLTDSGTNLRGFPGLFVLAVAAIVHDLWADANVAIAIGLAQGKPPWRVYRAGFGIQVISTLVNMATALTVLWLVDLDSRMLLVVPAVLLCLRQAYIGRLNGQEEREGWQQLLEATRGLAELDERVVLTRAATSAAKLFSANSAEVELASGRLVRGTEDNIVYDGPAADAPPRDAHRVIERPIGLGNTPYGWVRLCFGGEVGLKNREQAMLGALAAELHSALANAEQHAKARHEATHDPTTGLRNRAGLLDDGQAPLADTATADLDSAAILVDLTGFREIVDTLGHAAGDAVLRHAAARLDAAAMPGELVARLDGDDFAIVLPRISDPAQATYRAEALLGAVAEPIEIAGCRLSVAGVAGIAYCVRASISLDELLRQAGVAVHGVRAGSGGRVGFYAPERDAGSVSRLVLASELRTALRTLDQLSLLYQPIIDLHTGDPVGAEALVRWQHPTRGQLLPDEFLPVVEHAGLMPDLTKAVFDIALGNAAEWSRHGIEVPVAVNVSPRTLLDREFPGQVAAALSRHRVPANRVTLEITETSVLSHLEVVDQVLAELRDLGIRLSLDNFGKGWSSLSHLARVPVHEVKLAATFTESLFSSPQAAAIVRGTLEIARALDLRVVAEGVTSAMQRATLVSLGCHAGQGAHFFPPLSAHKIGPALWSSAVRALAVSDGADVIPLSQRRIPRRDN
ncbi:MAG TPA: bifunctional diguanylate cyclase/phosphodiesterase [Mycobacteriales bacterium]|nr:bifunctional diguanylate cyclase/phosphodiesterase [Mycobacteriales bacterium]